MKRKMSAYEPPHPQTVCQSCGSAQYRASDNKNEYNFYIIAPAPVVPISFREWIEPQEGEAWRESVSRRSTTGRITAVRRMNGGELVSRAMGEVVTHPVAAPFRSLKASRSFLKTRPVPSDRGRVSLTPFLAGERECLLFARNQFVEHSRLIPWPGQVAGSPLRKRERWKR